MSCKKADKDEFCNIRNVGIDGVAFSHALFAILSFLYQA